MSDHRQRTHRQEHERVRVAGQRMSDETRAAADPEPIASDTSGLWERPEAATLLALREARITDCQLVPWGSNYTFAVSLDDQGRLLAESADGATKVTGIYKPGRGEIPLWDFDAGTLYKREYASYLLSCLLDWRFVPPTVIRSGPHGVGTVQLYVEPETGISDRVLLEEHGTALRRMFLFDLLTNNADRKASHCFVGRADRRVWGIDHGLTFHVQPKLRTILWAFCGDPVEPELIAVLEALEANAKRIRRLLRPYLDPAEIEMLFARARATRESRIFPTLNPRRNIPYGW